MPGSVAGRARERCLWFLGVYRIDEITELPQVLLFDASRFSRITALQRVDQGAVVNPGLPVIIGMSQWSRGFVCSFRVKLWMG